MIWIKLEYNNQAPHNNKQVSILMDSSSLKIDRLIERDPTL